MPPTIIDNEIGALLQQVRQWPRERQLSFAQHVIIDLDVPTTAEVGSMESTHSILSIEQIRTLLSESERLLDDDPSLDELEGILATDAPPPTDEEVERWLNERRMRKYGG